MGLSSVLKSNWLRAALIAPMSLVVLSAGKCGGGGGNKSGSSGGTYWCQCDCEATMRDSLTSTSFPYPVNDALTCADSESTALSKCPQRCEQKAAQDNQGTKTTVGGCKAKGATIKDPNSCVNKQSPALLAAKPKTASFEGPLDWGRSELSLRIPQKGDEARVKVKGSLVMVGGNCPNSQCPVALWLVDLAPLGGSFSTNKGMQFSGLKAINEGVWEGTKYADGTLQLSSQSQLTISSYRDGVHDVRVLYPSSHINGRIEHQLQRRTDSGSKSGSNALIVDGTLSGDDVEVDLHLHAWLTDCRPKASANASCLGGRYGAPDQLKLQSNASLLGSLIGADLCEAIKSGDPEDVCLAYGGEFSTFSCLDPGATGLTPQEIAQRLDFEWRDATGKKLGDKPHLSLTDYVSFPVTLSVQNEFGRGATTTIPYAPTGSSCPLPRTRLPDKSPRWPIRIAPGFGRLPLSQR